MKSEMQPSIFDRSLVQFAVGALAMGTVLIGANYISSQSSNNQNYDKVPVIDKPGVTTTFPELPEHTLPSVISPVSTTIPSTGS